MLNQVVLVGRLTEDLKVTTIDDKKEATLTLAVQRTFKNTDGIYEADFIECYLLNSIADSTSKYCHAGDIVGIKGHIQVNEHKEDNGNITKSTVVVAEKITFLSSKSSDKEQEG